MLLLIYKQELLNNILDVYPFNLFATHCKAICRVDIGANIHATNNGTDFIKFHPIKSNNIHLTVGPTAQ